MLSLLEMLRGVLSCGGGGEEDKKKICREIYEETGQNNPFWTWAICLWLGLCVMSYVCVLTEWMSGFHFHSPIYSVFAVGH